MYSPIEWPAPDLVARRAETTPDRTALVDADTGTEWSYRDLSDGAVATMAAGLRSRGLSAGDHLGLAVEPGVRVAQLVHAAARAGVRFVPLPPAAPPAALAARCAAADVDAVLAVGSAASGLPDVFDGPVLPVDDLDASPAELQPYRWNRDEVQWLVFTSGTTGEPRPVELTAGNLLASATASACRLGVARNDRWLACLPMHHVGGLAPVVRCALYGTTVVVQSGFDAEATGSALADHDVTGVSLVPTMLARLLDTGWQPRERLRFVLLGGAPAPATLIERCEAAGVPVHPTYGATETASQIATARPAEAFSHPGTVGRPLPEIGVSVVDHGGAPVPAGEPGELVVSGPTVARGYYGDVKDADGRFDDRRFRTRDRGYRDASGRLWVLGRLDEAIVTGGETVQPAAVETALRSDPAVEDAVVVGLSDDEWGQVVAALVVGTPGGEFDVSAVREHARERLPGPAVPKVVESAEELPRTASGTVDRDAARARLRRHRNPEGL